MLYIYIFGYRRIIVLTSKAPKIDNYMIRKIHYELFHIITVTNDVYS